MRLIDADALKELFPDNGEGSWTYNITARMYIDNAPMLDFEKTMQSEYQNGYWNGYNDAMERVRKEQKNEQI